MNSNSRIGKIALAGAFVAASGGAALGLTSIASAAGGRSATVVAVDDQQTAADQAAATADGRHRGPGFVDDGLAKVLGLSVDELRTQLEAGKTIAQIAETQKVDLADVKEAIIAAFKTHLDEEVASGEHTQAEADQKLADFTANIDAMVNNAGPMGRHGDRDHGGGSSDGTASSGASYSA